ncbi:MULTISPECIES: stability/partitioning determinant [Cupriavidus]|uniref:Stability/partitioning determinant n=1 Tax=Cupriavidus taiwanensis TaxID=164546 RepID=A0A7Z7JHW6_9BURK|nr:MULTISPECIES: stability/partitioning determinant [Cupriavidus]NOV26632.1 stability/partitioning determinant [Cupriavidus necator]NSX13245.1 stability/partitioning determinant [Cupriavidus taiwanensis]SOZ18880.1 conserved hypothetical protein [Cupriavidus taiwanensis]SOZ96996.1 conserved hypothetical protein [Cupriavidus taiwanensis]SPC25928.1 conserved hypothetical protein [Cupriavidus taiwanensis]
MSRANPLDLALDDFAPRVREEKPRVDRETVAQVAKENGFVSRDAKKVEAAMPSPRRQRRFTTGRNQQINIKATAETVARFNALADELNLPAGALLERAVQILEEKFKRG